MTLFGIRQIATAPARAQRVARGLQRLGPEVRDRVATGFLPPRRAKTCACCALPGSASTAAPGPPGCWGTPTLQPPSRWSAR